MHKYLKDVVEPNEIRPQLREQVEAIRESGNPATVALRALYRLYFDNKQGPNVGEKWFLFGEGSRYFLESDIPSEEDSQIFKKEADRYYQSLKKPKPPKKPKK